MRWAARGTTRLFVRTLEDRAVPSGTDAIVPPDEAIVKDVNVDPPVESVPAPYVPTQADIDRGYMLFDNQVVGLNVNPLFDSSMPDGPSPQNMPQPSLAQIGGRLWKDRDGNGLQDAGEPGLPNVNLRLVQPGIGLVGTTQTDAVGNYAFNVQNVTNGTVDPRDDGLKAGVSYQIFASKEQPALAGLRPTAANVGMDDLRDSDATITSGGCVVEFTMGSELIYSRDDIGYVPAATIGNLVWSDANNNGIKDPSEHGLAGVIVRLLDATEHTEVDWAMTAADGSYLFTALVPGTYTVEIDKGNFTVGAPLAGCASSTGSPGQVTGSFEGASTPGATGRDGQDHGWTSVDGSVHCEPITVSPGHLENKSIDFGFFRPGQFSGRVYVDMNANGQRDYEDSTGLAGIKVTAAGPAGMFTIATDQYGAYSFQNLPAATYTITEAPPTGYRNSTPTFLTATLGPSTPPIEIDFGAVRTVDLSVKLTARPNAVNVGGIITLTYRVKNLGTLDASGVSLMAPLPPGMIIVGVDQTGATFDAAKQRASIPTLAAGAEAVVVLRVRARRVGTFHLMAMVQGMPEDTMANNRSMVWAVVGMPWSPPTFVMSAKSGFLASAFRH